MPRQISRNRIEQVLLDSPLFGICGPGAVADLLNNFQREYWNKGQYLRPGRTRNYLMVVVDGLLEVTTRDPASDRVLTVGEIAPGSGFDLLPLVDTHPHEVDAQARTNTALAVFPVVPVRDWFHQHPEADAALLHEFATQIRRMETLAAELALCETSTRLARVILRKVAGIESRTLAYISQESLAHMIGSVRTVVNRHLLEFKKRGIVELGRNRVHVNHLEALADEAQLHHDNLTRGR